MDEIVALIESYGFLFYPITFVWTFLEGETFVIFAGYAAYHDVINAWGVLLSAWLGSFAGDQCWFGIGRRFGPVLLRRFPKWRGGIDLALSMLHHHNIGFILTFRFIYGIRNVSSFAMGMSALPWARFAALNFLAAGLWAGSFVGAGYLFGHASEALLGKAAKTFGLGALVVFIVVVSLLMRVHKRRLDVQRARAAAAAADLSEVVSPVEADNQTQGNAQGVKSQTD